jgi:hypothetical protein
VVSCQGGVSLCVYYAADGGPVGPRPYLLTLTPLTIQSITVCISSAGKCNPTIKPKLYVGYQLIPNPPGVSNVYVTSWSYYFN